MPTFCHVSVWFWCMLCILRLRFCFYFVFCDFSWKLDMICWIKGIEMNRLLVRGFCLTGIRLYYFCCGCRCQKLKFSLMSFLLSPVSGLPRFFKWSLRCAAITDVRHEGKRKCSVVLWLGLNLLSLFFPSVGKPGNWVGTGIGIFLPCWLVRFW